MDVLVSDLFYVHPYSHNESLSGILCMCLLNLEKKKVLIHFGQQTERKQSNVKGK